MPRNDRKSQVAPTVDEICELAGEAMGLLERFPTLALPDDHLVTQILLFCGDDLGQRDSAKQKLQMACGLPGASAEERELLNGQLHFLRQLRDILTGWIGEATFAAGAGIVTAAIPTEPSTLKPVLVEIFNPWPHLPAADAPALGSDAIRHIC